MSHVNAHATPRLTTATVVDISPSPSTSTLTRYLSALQH